MKSLKRLLTLLIVTAPTAVIAGDEEAVKLNDPTYSAISVSAVQADFDNLGTAINLDFRLGIAIPPLRRVLAAEIDLSSTLVPGENSGGSGVAGGNSGSNPLDPNGGGNQNNSGNRTAGNEDLRVNSVGIFLTGHTPGQFFGTARAGYRFVESSVDEIHEEGTGAAFGLGLGYRYAQNASLELNYTQYASDLGYISFVVNY